MTDRQSTHADDCWSWGPKHYECAIGKIERLRTENERLRAERDALARDAARYRYLLAKLQQAYDGECFESDRFSVYCRMSNRYKGDRTIQAEIVWRDKSGEPIGLSEAIDRARCVEGGGE